MFMHNANLEGSLLELKDAEGEADPAEAVTKALEAIDAKLAVKLGEIEIKSAERLDKLEARLNRPGATAPKASEEPAGDLERKAFTGYLRAGTRGMEPEEKKALSVGTLSAGGYLAPDQFTLDFVRDLTLWSPIRALADVKNTSSHTVLYLAAHPTCVRCGAPSSVVDHITPHRGDMKLFWRRSNWQALCRSCHCRHKQREERAR